MTERVDIEALVHWAIGVQKADVVVGRRSAGGMVSASADCCARIERQSYLGCGVDGGGYAERIDPDAELVYSAIGGLGFDARVPEHLAAMVRLSCVTSLGMRLPK